MPVSKSTNQGIGPGPQFICAMSAAGVLSPSRRSAI